MTQCAAGANTIYLNPHSKTQYAYNNLVYGVQSIQQAIEIDPYIYVDTETGGNSYVYNNTLVLALDSFSGVHLANRNVLGEGGEVRFSSPALRYLIIM